jgi:hypothetical protein
MRQAGFPLSRRAFLGLVGAGAAGGLLWLLRRDAPSPDGSSPPGLSGAASCPSIVPRADWGALPPNHSAPHETGFYSLDNPEGWREYSGDLRARYNTVVIHHSANYGRDDIHTLRYIQDRHRNDRGWADVAYHFFVGKTGTIYEGRPLNVRGTHVANHNTGTVGICLLGDMRTQTPTVPQLASTQELVRWLAAELALTHLAGHAEFNPETVCPGTNVMPYLDVFAAAAGLIHSTAGYMPSEEQATATAAAAAATAAPDISQH